MINKLKFNDKNPRKINDVDFEKLKNPIKRFPEMLEKRPIVYDENDIVVGGNMRLKALKVLAKEGFEIKDSYFLSCEGWTEEQKREFVIKDNVSNGEWDYETLINDWDNLQLDEWGLHVPKWQEENFDNKNKEIDINELADGLDIECPKCHFLFKKDV